MTDFNEMMEGLLADGRRAGGAKERYASMSSDKSNIFSNQREEIRNDKDY